MKRLILLLCLYSITGRAADFRKFGNYSVSLKRTGDGIYGNLIIKRNAKLVFKETEIGDHYYFGELSESEREKDRFSGTDINGNGIPDLVITRFTAGAHCCFYMYIFEMGENFHKIAEVEGGSYYINLIDLDGDKIPEIEFYDGAIDYQFASFAGSPPGRVVLKYVGDRYVIASNLMSKPLPSGQRLKTLLRKVRKDFLKKDSPDLPYSFLRLMMDWSYSGHTEDALKVVEKLWPPSLSGAQKFKSDFKAALNESPYWSKYK